MSNDNPLVQDFLFSEIVNVHFAGSDFFQVIAKSSGRMGMINWNEVWSDINNSQPLIDVGPSAPQNYYNQIGSGDHKVTQADLTNVLNPSWLQSPNSGDNTSKLTGWGVYYPLLYGPSGGGPGSVSWFLLPPSQFFVYFIGGPNTTVTVNIWKPKQGIGVGVNNRSPSPANPTASQCTMNFTDDGVSHVAWGAIQVDPKTRHISINDHGSYSYTINNY